MTNIIKRSDSSKASITNPDLELPDSLRFDVEVSRMCTETVCGGFAHSVVNVAAA